MAIRQAMNAYRDSRLDDAAQACATVISWDSRTFRRAPLAGVVRFAQGDAPEAVRLLTEAVKLKARSPEAANDLGRALHGTGDHVAAMAQHERALSLRRPIRRHSTASAMHSARSDGWRRRCRAISAR